LLVIDRDNETVSCRPVGDLPVMGDAEIVRATRCFAYFGFAGRAEVR
jgi:hypothetical protein